MNFKPNNLNVIACYEELLAHLLTFMEMPKGFRELLFPVLIKPKFYQEDTLKLKAGEVADTAYWLVTGYTRAYQMYKPEEDREMFKQRTIDLSTPKRISLPAQSFMNQTVANYNLEIAKGSIVIGISYSSFLELGEKMPEVYQLAAKIIAAGEEEWLQKMNICRLTHLYGYPAFLNHFGEEVEAFIYQMHIASYIGVTPEWLSKIRKATGFNGPTR